MATFLVAHGAWSAGWAWKKMHPAMRRLGHELIVPTYTGLGERGHLAHKDIDLEAHIADVMGVLHAEDIEDAILVGHSYGGMVATGVADRAPGRFRHLVYVDAFVPRDGESVMDLRSPDSKGPMLEAVRTSGEGWKIPANPMPPDTSAADLAWIMPRRMTQPLKTFEQRLRLAGAVEKLPRTYIYCKRARPDDGFRKFADRARSEPGWTLLEIDSSHNPNITAPDELAALLDGVARR